MSSAAHDFIVAALVRKARQLGYKPICMDGRHKSSTVKKPPITPRIVRHRPDVVAIREDGSFCICEAKTAGDIESDRTQSQMVDFYNAVSTGNGNLLILGTSMKGKEALGRVLKRFELLAARNLIVIYVPEALLPNEAEV